jgi:hypothetical protein
MKVDYIGENEVCLESCDVLASPIILGCNQCMLQLKNINFVRYNSKQHKFGPLQKS